MKKWDWVIVIILLVLVPLSMLIPRSIPDKPQPLSQAEQNCKAKDGVLIKVYSGKEVCFTKESIIK